MKTAKELADEHIDWLLEILKPLLKAEFEHGYKHGIEERDTEMRNICGCGHLLAVYSLGNKKIKDVLCRCCRNRVNKELGQNHILTFQLERVKSDRQRYEEM